MTASSAASPRSAIPDITAPLAGSTGSTADPDRRDGRSLPMSPPNILLELIVALLTPMFLSAGSGDLRLARLAAMETVASYGARTQAELMNIAQVIGFGLAAMDSLLLSMRPELSLTMKLRLRSGANALNRSAQQNNRMLDKRRRDNPGKSPAPRRSRRQARRRRSPRRHPPRRTSPSRPRSSMPAPWSKPPTPTCGRRDNMPHLSHRRLICPRLNRTPSSQLPCSGCRRGRLRSAQPE